ncbi:MAG: YfhO family protein [Ruminococcus sp.]|nr:YfhO family protein [Ruminococcus sp.]
MATNESASAENVNTPAETAQKTKTELKAEKRAARIRRIERLMSTLQRPAFLYLLCFVLPVGIMYLAYALFGVHPFGEGSVLVLDLNGQYVYYYEMFRDAVLGKGSLIYSWSRNLSGNLFGIYAYYLASPFMILVVLFPRTAMCGAIETIQLLKIGSSALSFAYFLNKTADKKPRRTSVVAFSLMYSLMSYMIVQLMDPMWLDGLIYLPLIALGVKRLVREGKVLPYVIPLTLMFIAHFYIGYMMGFFTFCYFIYTYFGEDGRILPKKPISSLFKFAGGTLTAILAASWVLIPVYNALKLGKLEFSEPNWSMATQFDFLTFLTKLFPMSYDTVYPEGLPMVYCGTAVLLLVPLYFMNRKISMKRKVSSGILSFIMIVFMYIKPVDIVWHGFQVPNWLPFRYSFAFSFLMVVMAFEAFENLDGITPKEIGGVFFGIVMFLVWCEREGYEHFEIFRTVAWEDGKDRAVIGGIWFSAIAVAVYFLIIYLNRKYRLSYAVCAITCIVVSLEMLANTMDTLQKIDNDVVYSDYTSYEPYISETRDAVRHIRYFDDEPFYRMEATFHRTVNDPIGTGYYGISHSSSVMNAPALTMLERLGFAYGGHYTKYDGRTFITDSVFDIKYIMNKEDEDNDNRYIDKRIKIPEQYKLATHVDENSVHLSYEDVEKNGRTVKKKVKEKKRTTYKFYQNPYAMGGLGCVTDERINTIELSKVNPFENQNLLYSVLAGEPEVVPYFTRIVPKDSDRLNMSTAKISDEEHHTKYYPTDKSAGEAHIDYVVEMDRDGELYMYLPTRYERTCNVWVKDEESYLNGDGVMDFAGQFFVGDNYSILQLGSFMKGENVRIRVTIDNDDNEAYWSDELFYTFDTERFEQSAGVIQQSAAEVTSLSDTRVTMECDSASDGQYLFTTIPDEPGWTVTVNGKRVITDTSMDSLITIPLESGANKIEMVFEPSYFTGSIIISIAGVIVILIIFLFEYKNGRLIELLAKKAESGKKQK